jgi:hypothetical protein
MYPPSPSTLGRARRALHIALFALVMAAMFAPSASPAEELETLFADPAVTEDEALFDLLLYQLEVNTAQGGPERKHTDILLDGSEVNLFLTSLGKSDAHSVCARWVVLKGDAPLTQGHGCYPWFDAAPHTQLLLTAEQAAAADKLVVENFDVKGPPPAWDGQGTPADTLGHQRGTYALLPAPPSADTPPTDTPPTDTPPSDTSPTASAESIVTRALVERGLRASAKGILKCAHPTGKFQSMTVNHFVSTETGHQADFTISYQCLVGKRACKISLSATFDAAGGFQDFKVVEDTAKTDPSIGLKACKSLLEALRR